MTSDRSDRPVDLDQLRSHTEGDAELEREVIALFKSVSDSYASRLDQLVDEGGKAWSDTAHGFKGAAANIGARGLSGMLARAEELGEAPAAARRQALDAIGAEFDRVAAFLDRLHG